jgi:4-hydroxythreonine-4-phosphate dehydrogenase
MQLIGRDAAIRFEVRCPCCARLGDGERRAVQIFATGQAGNTRAHAALTLALFQPAAIDAAISLAMDSAVGAVVTAPINKEALRLANIDYAGHTEIFAHKSATRDYAMLLVHDQFRVAHVSTHLSLREACDAVTSERVGRVIELVHDALSRLGLQAPRIAVAGLNPHAGENGLFGREELEQIDPAVQNARSRGLLVEGPLPPDTVFARAASGAFDCVVAMYHDQGHIPVKMLGFAFDAESGSPAQVRGINVTLGLPIVRTSVDHGTAFDLAGRGVASEASMVEAMRYAVLLARPRLSAPEQEKRP